MEKKRNCQFEQWEVNGSSSWLSKTVPSGRHGHDWEHCNASVICKPAECVNVKGSVACTCYVYKEIRRWIYDSSKQGKRSMDFFVLWQYWVCLYILSLKETDFIITGGHLTYDVMDVPMWLCSFIKKKNNVLK